MQTNLRLQLKHANRPPVLRYAALLFLLTAALVVAVALTLDRNASRSSWQQSSTALGAGAHVGASAFGTLRSNLRVRASQLATSLPLQRAIVTGDNAQIRSIAVERHARIVIGDRSIGGLPPSPRVTSTAKIVSGTHLLATVTVALPLGNALLTLMQETTPLPKHAALLLAYDGRIIAGGPKNARFLIRNGRTVFGKTPFAIETAPMPVRGATVLAVEPVSAIDSLSSRYRGLVILAAIATLAIAAILAVKLARPLSHIVGEVARLSRQAQTDALTGLANRRGLSDRLEAELERANERGTTVSLVIADIDNFKLVNDGEGHQRGDEILNAVAGAIGSSVREAELAARHGGDEFAIVLPGARLADAEQTAERIRRAVASIRSTEGRSVSMSFGVAEFPTYGSADGLVAAADAALYEAKRQGKNQVATATIGRAGAIEDSEELLAIASTG
ncbi:MAG TPA: GGDEF domain-containing protein [Gaiellaceae bacterium]|jgi:diguanylate cyclase (GGDEF)-like protein